MSKEFKVGVLGLVAAVVLYFGFNFLKGEDFFSGQEDFYAKYEDIDGLANGNPVILNGFVVGKVRNIELSHEPGDSLIVAFSIKSDVIIGDGSKIELANNGLLEGKCLNLHLGQNKNVFEGGEFLTPLVEPSIAGLIEEKAMPVVTGLDSVLTGVGRLVDKENTEKLSSAFSSLDKTMKNFEQVSQNLNSIVVTNKYVINGVLKNFEELSDSLNATLNDVRPVIRKLDNLADSLNDMELKSLVANANATMGNLESITMKIDSGKGSIGKLINEDSIAVSMNKAISDLDSLFIDVEENPSRYVHISVFGKKDKKKKK